MTWEIIITRQAAKDANKLASAGLKSQAESLLTILAENPYKTYPPYEKLKEDLAGYYFKQTASQLREIATRFDAQISILDELMTQVEAENRDYLVNSTRKVRD